MADKYDRAIDRFEAAVRAHATVIALGGPGRSIYSSRDEYVASKRCLINKVNSLKNKDGRDG